MRNMLLKKLLVTSSMKLKQGSRRLKHGHMRTSRMFPVLNHTLSPTFREQNPDLNSTSASIMTQLKLLMREASGTFSLLPDLARSLEKLHRLIDKEMQSIGAQKITMPCLASKSMWSKTGRWEGMGEELLHLKDRQGKQLCLAPTHEETVTSIVANLSPVKTSSLPIKLYQIGRKFRDEMRPKHGLMRCREFEMKDLYTFDESLEKAAETYADVCDAYVRLFTALELPHVQVEASTGVMGGKKSQEFHLVSDVGEDTLYSCNDCKRAFNKETIDDGLEICNRPNCNRDFKKTPGIEVAHAFLLGDKYSSVFKAEYQHQNSKHPLKMGCFGIGVTRLLSACVEVLSSEDSIRWPSLLAPYQVCIIPQKDGYQSDQTNTLAENLQNNLTSIPNMHREIVLDDRTNYSIGKRLKTAKMMGYPYAIVVGRKALESPSLYEYINIYQEKTEYLTAEQIHERISSISVIPV